jgi:cobalt-zinc-cadmium efflux system protein
VNHVHRPKASSSAAHLTEYRSVEKKKLGLALIITAAVMGLEVAGGILSRSLALVSDAGHMLTHTFALGISLAAIVLANRPVCCHRTYGVYRLEILAALFNSLFLFAVTAWILFESIQRFFAPEQVLSGQMLVVAMIGLAANLATAWLLRGASRSDMNVRSAFLHMLSDTVSSLAILIGAGVISVTGWNIIDPLLSSVIALVIFAWGWDLFKDAVNVLLETAPKGLTSEEIIQALKESFPDIREISDLHVWVITSRMFSMTAYVKVKEGLTVEQRRHLCQQIRRLADERYDIEHVTIEIE